MEISFRHLREVKIRCFCYKSLSFSCICRIAAHENEISTAGFLDKLSNSQDDYLYKGSREKDRNKQNCQNNLQNVTSSISVGYKISWCKDKTWYLNSKLKANFITTKLTTNWSIFYLALKTGLPSVEECHN